MGWLMTVWAFSCFFLGLDPKNWPWLLLLVLLLVLGNQAVTQGKNKLLHAYTPFFFFYKFWTPYKMNTRRVDFMWPRPPLPKYSFGGLWLKNHSDPHRVKYFWEALDLKYPLGHYWGLPRPPWPLTPWTPIGVALWGGGGLNQEGDLMSLTPKCDMFLESQELSHSAQIG